MPIALPPRPSLWKPPMGSNLDLGHPLMRGLVACWIASEGGGNRAQDAIPDHLVGAMAFNGNPRWSGGLSGVGLTFDGAADYLLNSSTISGISTNTGRYSIVAWAQPASVSAGAHMVFVAGSVGGGYSVLLRRDANVWSLFQKNGAPDVGAQSTADLVVANQWHQVVGTWDGAAIRLYVHGVLRTTTAVTGRTRAGSAQAIGGGGGIEAAQFWDGSIDHVLVYDRAISQAEIQWLHEEPYTLFRGPEKSHLALNFRSAVVSTRRRQSVVG